MEKLGFIGLGIMGKPMALNMLRAGHRLTVNDLNADAVEELVRAGAQSAGLGEIGQSCDIVFTMLPDGDVVQQVLFGERGIAGLLRKGALVVDMSSVGPAESQHCARELAKSGVSFLDAPVSGGEPKAIDGTLAFMVGGRQGDYDRAKPYFDAMGASSILVGDTGSGSTTKLVNQIIVNLNIAAVSEGFVLAAKCGVDPLRVYEAIKGGLAQSTIMDAKIPMITQRNFKPGGKMSTNRKDIRNVMKTAHELEIPLPFTSQMYEIMQTMKVHGCMDMDHGSIVRYFEELAGVEVKAK